MSKKKKLVEMAARKNAIQAKIKALRESRSRTGLAFLIESELEKAEIILAAKSIVDKLGKMAEDLAKVEGDDVMPMMDSLKTAYGPQMADSFQKLASETLRNTVQALTQAKDSLGTEVGKFEGVLNGDSTGSDMANYDDAAAPVDATADAGMDIGGDAMDTGAADAEGDDDFDFGNDDAEGGEGMDDLFGGDEDAGNAAGRARKESHMRRAKAINEGLLDSMKAYLAQHTSKAPATGSPRARLEALKPFLTAEDYEIVAQFPDQLLTTIFAALDSNAASVTTPVVSTPSAAIGGMGDMGADMGDEMGDEMDMAMPMDDEESLDDIGHEHLAAANDPIDADFSAIESPLASVEDPDAMVYDDFRESVRRGATPLRAARRIAEKFSIDFADVVQIIKEGSERSRNAKVSAPGKTGTVAMTKDIGKPGKPRAFTRPFSSKDAAEKHAKEKGLTIEEAKKKKAKKPNPFAKKDDDKKDDGKKSDKKENPFGKKKAKPFEKKVEEARSPGKTEAHRRAGKPAAVGARADEDYQNGSDRMQSSSAPRTPTAPTPPSSTSKPAISTPKPGATTSAPTPAQQPKAMPSDVAKAKQLADKITTGDFDPEELEANVAKNIGSVGKSATDVQKYSQYVRDELAARGVIQEAKRRKK